MFKFDEKENETYVEIRKDGQLFSVNGFNYQPIDNDNVLSHLSHFTTIDKFVTVKDIIEIFFNYPILKQIHTDSNFILNPSEGFDELQKIYPPSEFSILFFEKHVSDLPESYSISNYLFGDIIDSKEFKKFYLSLFDVHQLLDYPINIGMMYVYYMENESNISEISTMTYMPNFFEFLQTFITTFTIKGKSIDKAKIISDIIDDVHEEDKQNNFVKINGNKNT